MVEVEVDEAAKDKEDRGANPEDLLQSCRRPGLTRRRRRRPWKLGTNIQEMNHVALVGSPSLALTLCQFITTDTVPLERDLHKHHSNKSVPVLSPSQFDTHK